MKTLPEASAFLLKLVKHQKARLEYGQKDRARIQKQLDRGQEPTGARVTFLTKSANKIISLMAELAQEYDNVNINDKISTDDLVDCLATAENKLAKYLKNKKKNDDEFT